MYALYAVTIKASRSSARLLKNNENEKTFPEREAFFCWIRGFGELRACGPDDEWHTNRWGIQLLTCRLSGKLASRWHFYLFLPANPSHPGKRACCRVILTF
jgi:hypothetical protein